MVASARGAAPPVVFDLLEAIGATPMVRLPGNFAPELQSEIYLKLEFLNPGGSVKDRIARGMVLDAEHRGALRPGGTIVECTSGNTGLGLAMVAAARGYRCLCVAPDRVSREKLNALRALGAEVLVTSSAVPPDDPRHCTQLASRLAREIPGAWFSNQLANPANPQAHYESTGPEIWEQMEGRLDVFVGGCGTGGTVSGVARYLKEQEPRLRVAAVDPPGSILEGFWRSGRAGAAGAWFVEGVGEDLIPAVWEPRLIDAYHVIEEREAFAVARRLARETGVFAGGSSGMVVAGALREARRAPAGARIVALLPDSGQRYLSKLFDPDWLADHDLEETPPGETASAARLLRARPPFYAGEDDVLAAAARLMREHGTGAVPVISAAGDRVLGVVSEELLLQAAARGTPLEQVTCGSAAAFCPLLRADAPWTAVLTALQSHPAVLVLRDGGAHLLERRDLLRSLPRLGAASPR